MKMEMNRQAQRAFGYAAKDASGILSPFHFSRRANGESDITMKVLYCGICHSDLHMIRNEHGISSYPIVPGHEIIGVVTQVGVKVRKFKAGDRAGVGCLTSSCGSCENCSDGLENYCPRPTYTYTMFERAGEMKQYGGYSDIFVVDEDFAVRIPDGAMLLAGYAPLLCAGITVYSPIRHHGLDRPGKHVGVVGLGGLGHLAVKFAKALGAEVTVISGSENKRKEAVERLGADSFILSSDTAAMKAAMGTMHGIINTSTSATHLLKQLLDLLKTDGKLIMLGAPDLEKPAEIPIYPLFGRKCVTGSMTGSMKETQEMIDFAAMHGINADVEVIKMEDVNLAMDRLASGDIRYRFVIDIGNSFHHARTKIN